MAAVIRRIGDLPVSQLVWKLSKHSDHASVVSETYLAVCDGRSVEALSTSSSVYSQW